MGKKVNQTELAAILGVTDVTLWEWQKIGMPVVARGERGQANEYDTSEVIAWKIETEVQKVRKESPRDALFIAQTELARLQVGEKSRSLLSAIELKREFDRMILVARQQFLQLPQLMQIDEPRRVELAASIEAILKELSNYDPCAGVHPVGDAPVGAADTQIGGGLG